jgi:type VI secretion system secreted protein Hcp
MPGNAFIQFKEYGGAFPQGESEEKGHEGTKGWIEIADWDWEVSSDSSSGKGTGSSVGKAVSEGFNFSHFYDKSSSKLMAMIVMGKTFESVTIDMLKQTGSGTPVLFLQIVARDVLITKVATKGQEDGTVTQDISFTFKQVALGYKMQKDDGKTLAAAKLAHWNVSEQTEDTPNIKLSIK